MKKIGKVLLNIARFLHENGEVIIVSVIILAFIFSGLFLLYKIGQITGLWYIPAIILVFLFILLMSSSFGGMLVDWLEELVGEDEK